jgi:hypothetical protein
MNVLYHQPLTYNVPKVCQKQVEINPTCRLHRKSPKEAVPEREVKEEICGGRPRGDPATPSDWYV